MASTPWVGRYPHIASSATEQYIPRTDDDHNDDNGAEVEHVTDSTICFTVNTPKQYCHLLRTPIIVQSICQTDELQISERYHLLVDSNHKFGGKGIVYRAKAKVHAVQRSAACTVWHPPTSIVLLIVFDRSPRRVPSFRHSRLRIFLSTWSLLLLRIHFFRYSVDSFPCFTSVWTYLSTFTQASISGAQSDTPTTLPTAPASPTTHCLLPTCSFRVFCHSHPVISKFKESRACKGRIHEESNGAKVIVRGQRAFILCRKNPAPTSDGERGQCQKCLFHKCLSWQSSHLRHAK